MATFITTYALPTFSHLRTNYTSVVGIWSNYPIGPEIGAAQMSLWTALTVYIALVAVIRTAFDRFWPAPIPLDKRWPINRWTIWSGIFCVALPYIVTCGAWLLIFGEKMPRYEVCASMAMNDIAAKKACADAFCDSLKGVERLWFDSCQ